MNEKENNAVELKDKQLEQVGGGVPYMPLTGVAVAIGSAIGPVIQRTFAKGTEECKGNCMGNSVSSCKVKICSYHYK